MHYFTTSNTSNALNTRWDYYPFGMEMPGRQNVDQLSGPVPVPLPVSYNLDYRYAYNGMETDGEVSGSGNSYTTEFRQYDPRLGRWKSLDPLMAKFPNMSPYCAFNNNPVYFVDPFGLEGGPYREEPKTYEIEDNEDNSGAKSKLLNRRDIRDMYLKDPDYKGLNNLEFNRRVGVNFEMAYLATKGIYTQSSKQFYSKTRALRTKGQRKYVKPDRVSGTTVVTTQVGGGKIGFRVEYFKNTAFTEVKLTKSVSLYTSRQQIRGMIAVLSSKRKENQKFNKDTRVRASLTLVVPSDTRISGWVQRKCAQEKIDLYVVIPYVNEDGTISFTSPKMLVDGLNVNTINTNPITDYMNETESVDLPFQTDTSIDPSSPDVEVLEQ